MIRKLLIAALIVGFIATTAPLAHLLEMISKLTLDGPLWLGIQQNLYRGWGPVFGPVEIIAFLLSLSLVIVSREMPAVRRAAIVTTLCYGGMLACFFIFNGPVNAALNGWTPSTLPPDWSSYRARWETGHALAALLSVIAFVILLRARLHLESARIAV